MITAGVPGWRVATNRFPPLKGMVQLSHTPPHKTQRERN